MFSRNVLNFEGWHLDQRRNDCMQYYVNQSTNAKNYQVYRTVLAFDVFFPKIFGAFVVFCLFVLFVCLFFVSFVVFFLFFYLQNKINDKKKTAKTSCSSSSSESEYVCAWFSAIPRIRSYYHTYTQQTQN